MVGGHQHAEVERFGDAGHIGELADGGVLIGAEHAVEEVMHEFFHESALGVQVAAEWVIAALVGGFVGLVEVALASELIARSPRGQRTQ